MKTFFAIAIAFSLTSSFANAQSINDNIDLRPLLFRSFIPGTVVMKSGNNEAGVFNYNTDNQSIIFIENKQFMALSGLENVQEIQLDKAVFIPINGKLYEKTAKDNLYISYSNKPVSQTTSTDKAGTSLKASDEVSNDLSNIYLTRKYNNKNGIAYIKNYWLLNGTSLVSLKSVKQLAKALNVPKESVSEYITSNKVNLDYDNDVIALLNHFAK